MPAQANQALMFIGRASVGGMPGKCPHVSDRLEIQTKTYIPIPIRATAQSFLLHDKIKPCITEVCTDVYFIILNRRDDRMHWRFSDRTNNQTKRSLVFWACQELEPCPHSGHSQAQRKPSPEHWPRGDTGKKAEGGKGR